MLPHKKKNKASTISVVVIDKIREGQKKVLEKLLLASEQTPDREFTTSF